MTVPHPPTGPHHAVHLPRRANWAGRYFLAVLLGVLGGAAWAVTANPRLSNQLRISLTTPAGKRPSGTRESGSSSAATKTPPPATPPVEAPPPPTPAPPETASTAPPSPPAAAVPYSDEEVRSAVAAARDALKRCRFRDAEQRLSALAEGRVPAALRDETTDLRRRIGQYQDLIAESPAGAVQEMGRIAILTLNGGRQLRGTIVAESPQQVTVQMLGGSIKTTIRVDEIRAKDFYTEYETRKLLDDELQKRLGAIRNRNALKLYDAADYCIRSGLAEQIVPILDQAIDADPDLLNSVREDRAYRLYQTFLFFLNSNARDEAQVTLDLIRRKYPRSKYVGMIGKEEDEYMAYLAEQEKKAAEKAAAPPGKSASSGPVETSPRDLFVDRPETEGGPSSVPATGPEAEAQKVLVQGNEAYDQAVAHLRESDPNRNPEHADEENLEALKYFKKAFEQYLKAQEIRDSPWLQDRIRDTNFKRAGCMKRSIKR